MKKRLFALILAVLMLLCLVSGCGGGSTTAESDADTADTETAAPADYSGEDAFSDAEDAAEAQEGSGAEETADPEDAAGPEDAASESGLVRQATVDLPLTEETVSFTYWAIGQPFMTMYNIGLDETQFFSEMEKRTNVHMEITTIPFMQVNEQFSIMVASDDLLDLVESFSTCFTEGLDVAIEDGYIINLADYLDTYMPNYKAALYSNPQFVKDSFTNSGRLGCANCLYGTPEGATQGGQIRKDWLDAVGLDAPVTYDDMTNVLTAFRDQLGITGAYNIGSYGVDYLSIAGFDVDGHTLETDDAMIVVDGVVSYGPIQDGYKEYVKTLSQWYSEGFIYQDFMTQDDFAAKDLIIAGTIGIHSAERDLMVSAPLMSDDENMDFVGLAPLVQYEGQRTHIKHYETVTATDGPVISTRCSDIELAMRWLDYCYTEEGELLTNYGVEGVSFEYNDEGEPELTDLVLHNETYSVIVCILLYTRYNGAQLCNGARYMESYPQNVIDACEKWNSVGQEYMFPDAASMDAEDTGEFSNIMSDIRTYVTEHTGNFIMGVYDIDAEWDNYVETIKSLGIDRAVELKQASYEAYEARDD